MAFVIAHHLEPNVLIRIRANVAAAAVYAIVGNQHEVGSTGRTAEHLRETVTRPVTDADFSIVVHFPTGN